MPNKSEQGFKVEVTIRYPGREHLKARLRVKANAKDILGLFVCEANDQSAIFSGRAEDLASALGATSETRSEPQWLTLEVWDGRLPSPQRKAARRDLVATIEIEAPPVCDPWDVRFVPESKKNHKRRRHLPLAPRQESRPEGRRHEILGLHR